MEERLQGDGKGTIHKSDIKGANGAGSRLDCGERSDAQSMGMDEEWQSENFDRGVKMKWGRKPDKKESHVVVSPGCMI